MESIRVPANRVMIGDRINGRMVEGIHKEKTWSGDMIVFEFLNYEVEEYDPDQNIEVMR